MSVGDGYDEVLLCCDIARQDSHLENLPMTSKKCVLLRPGMLIRSVEMTSSLAQGRIENYK